MSGVETIAVAAAEADLRLDRWFKRRYPQVTQGHLQKLLRTGQVRVDGKRAKANQRLATGQSVRVPPLPGDAPPPPEPKSIDAREAKALRERVLHRDDNVMAIDKPAGLAVQGGTRTETHLDAMLDALQFGAPERPRLVHRLDKDTSGVLLLARTGKAATFLTRAFRGKDARKLYWALVAGVPDPPEGEIRLRLAKRGGKGGERVVPVEDGGQAAVTRLRVIEVAAKTAAWLALEPLTGRTHQLRVHLAAAGHPIVGDGKYGGSAAFLPGGNIDRRMHLHARRIVVPHPEGGTLDVTAPLPEHMARTWRFFGFETTPDADAPLDG